MTIDSDRVKNRFPIPHFPVSHTSETILDSWPTLACLSFSHVQHPVVADDMRRSIVAGMTVLNRVRIHMLIEGSQGREKE